MQSQLPKIRGENGRLTHPRRPPIIFLSFSDGGLSSGKGIALAVLAVFLPKDRPITFVTDYSFTTKPAFHQDRNYSHSVVARNNAANKKGDGFMTHHNDTSELSLIALRPTLRVVAHVVCSFNTTRLTLTRDRDISGALNSLDSMSTSNQSN